MKPLKAVQRWTKRASLAFLLAAAALPATWDGIYGSVTVVTIQIGPAVSVAGQPIPSVTEFLLKSSDPDVTGFRVDVAWIDSDGKSFTDYTTVDISPQFGMALAPFLKLDPAQITSIKITPRKDSPAVTIQ